jgi:hypothetical protein
MQDGLTEGTQTWIGSSRFGAETSRQMRGPQY